MKIVFYRSLLRLLPVLVGLILLPLRLYAAENPPVTVTENDLEMILDNGLVVLTINKKGAQVSSIKVRRGGQAIELGNGRDALYFDANGAPATPPANPAAPRPRGDYAHPLSSDALRIAQNGPERADIAVSGKPSEWFPFQTEVHYVLPRGESGFYVYAIYTHGTGMPAAALGQTRFAMKGVPGTRLFTNHIVDDRRKGPFPTSPTVETLQDATYRLSDGTIYTKYDNTAYAADDRVHGMAGHGIGLWMIFPSSEFLGGGPTKQELTVHEENTLLGMLLGGHFGSGGVDLKAGEVWHKCFGPLFVYVNQRPSLDALWEDAKQRAHEEAVKWPYAWVQDKTYAQVRGKVSGSIRLTNGASARNAWAILAPPGQDWSLTNKGYDYWTRVDNSGKFLLDKVSPGHYTLFVSGANQFEDFRRENVEVKAGTTTALGALAWQPVTHGKTLWQIGIADRSSGEFRDGDNYRHYGNFLRYPQTFPDDVTFTIGKSKEKQDWNFAQWNWYSRRPYWTIRFNVAKTQTGKATLTLGFASVQPPRGRQTNLQIKVNGQEVSVVHLAKSGTAAYRSGNQDSVYNVVTIPFDAKLLRLGANEITLGHAEAIPFSASEAERKKAFGDVMYDAIRLEIAP